MNYPVWDLGSISGGGLIALVAIHHVYISHLAVGGGLFVFWLDWVQYRTGHQGLEAFLKRWTLTFVLITMVWGGVTGVGIWWTIALVHPTATSSLIHTFVWGWAIEWVFFFVEIVALVLYYYRFAAMPRDFRRWVAFVYFAAAWLSLFTINGILTYMLTPGDWLQTHAFWDGFFNPTFWPALVYRTGLSAAFAGVFGMLVGSWQRDAEVRELVVRPSAVWTIAGVLATLPSSVSYVYAVPEAVRHRVFELNGETEPYIQLYLVGSVVLFVSTLPMLAARVPRVPRLGLAGVAAFAGFFVTASFEHIREYARRPYIIYGYMWSNGLTDAQIAKMNEEGALADAKWIPPEARGDDPVARGRAIVETQCTTCHTVAEVGELTESLTWMGIVAQLHGQGKVFTYMPPFAGTLQDKKDVAEFISRELHGREPKYVPDTFDRLPEPQGVALPESVERPEGSDDYVLLAWNDLGMHCATDADDWFMLLPPGNSLEAQLIKKGEKPELITSGVELTYQVQEGFEHPEKHVAFWDYVESNLGVALEEGKGLAGHEVDHGHLEPNPDVSSWIAHFVPIVPYPEGMEYMPYPTYTIEARDEHSGELLARTKMVAPVSTEMNCRNCHGGEWRFEGVSGVDGVTAENLLEIHDKHTGTTLAEDARNGKPKACQTCHPDPALSADGTDGMLTLSTSMHAFHANYVWNDGQDACAMCHPAQRQGQTECLRGVHGQLQMECDACHGTLDEHAMGLVQGELYRGRDEARLVRLVDDLESDKVESWKDVQPRTPWLQQPDCTSCHTRFHEPAEDATGFNKWVAGGADLFRMRTDNSGMRCEACHGPPHALYPAKNPWEPLLDSMQPLQLQGNNLPIGSEERCDVCHGYVPEVSVHHPNQLRPFRNEELIYRLDGDTDTGAPEPTLP